MATGLIFGSSGAGKTVNSVKVSAKSRGVNLLMCSDNSSRVLENFETKNLEIQIVPNWLKSDKKLGFIEEFERNAMSKKYDCIIVDNISNIFETAILDLDKSGIYKDMRQAYKIVYDALKRLIRLANEVDCDVLFTAWESIDENIVMTNGTMGNRRRPELPSKISNSFMGLCNVVGHVENALDSNGVRRWYYNYEGNEFLIVKDQLYIRKSGMPENIFKGEK